MVTVNNLTKNYGDYHLNISMEIPDGRITGIIGKNGAGKSTTIKSILGLVHPDAGHVLVFGKNAGSLSRQEKENIGVALSDSGFSMYLTITDIKNILKKMYCRFDEEFFQKKCTSLGLPMNKQLKNFSTGMKAKLRVLSAISHNAKLLILDEPTAGLDVEARSDILNMLREYVAADEERSILISSHISSDLENLCDDIYLLSNGKMIVHEDTDRILSEYAILKLNESEYNCLDKDYILATRKEPFGYVCFTSQRNYYMENNPGIVIEKAGLDDLILMMEGK